MFLMINLTTTLVFAVTYMKRDVTISGGVVVNGEIAVFEEDGETPFESYDFPLFTGGVEGEYMKTFLIQNTGNQIVYVYWDISDSNFDGPLKYDYWGRQAGYYITQDDMIKYHLNMYMNPGDGWDPRDTTPAAPAWCEGSGAPLRRRGGAPPRR